jgi:hypothetical protein
MSEFRQITEVVQIAKELFYPHFFARNFTNTNFEQDLLNNWVDVYASNRVTLAKKVVSLVKYRLPSEYLPKFLQKDLLLAEIDFFESCLMENLDNYGLNKFAQEKFLNKRRLQSITKNFNSPLESTLLYLNQVGRFTLVDKETMDLLILTFTYCLRYVILNLNVKEPNLEKLKALELPLEVEQLRFAVENCNDLGQLFNWEKETKGFLYWAKLYLRRDYNFEFEVYSMLNKLHPELNLKPKQQQLRTETIRFANGSVWGDVPQHKAEIHLARIIETMF